jgi:type IV secretory pathway VirB4 component
LGRLASPNVYYILSGNDFSLDINNPIAPKVVCMGNNPQKQQVYGAVLSLYISRLIKVVNKKGNAPCSLIFDEFPTIYFNGIDSLIATARSNKVSTVIAVQDYSQLKKEYGRDMAEVIMNIIGNVICGQVMGDTAKQLSERFGKIMQNKNSLSITGSDTSVTKSKQFDTAIPTSIISSLSSGEFVGTIADYPDNKIALKMFHCELKKSKSISSRYTSCNKYMPIIKNISSEIITMNYNKIKGEVNKIADCIIEDLQNSPQKAHLLVKK